jgi:hypothetical protein
VTLRHRILRFGSSARILCSIRTAGIDELTIFPDLDGLGRLLAITLRDEARE